MKSDGEVKVETEAEAQSIEAEVDHGPISYYSAISPDDMQGQSMTAEAIQDMCKRTAECTSSMIMEDINPKLQEAATRMHGMQCTIDELE